MKKKLTADFKPDTILGFSPSSIISVTSTTWDVASPFSLRATNLYTPLSAVDTCSISNFTVNSPYKLNTNWISSFSLMWKEILLRLTSFTCSTWTLCLLSSLTAFVSLNQVHSGVNLERTWHSTITVFFFTIFMTFGFSLITGITKMENECY